MGLFEHWPYTNFHDLNLNWIISKIKNIETAEQSTAASEQAAAASADAAAASAESAQASAENAASSEESAGQSAESAQNYAEHIADPVSGLVTGWLDDNITPTTPPVDASLTVQGAAADAKATGDAINVLSNQISQFESIPYAVKMAMNTLFQNVAFKNSNVYTDELTVINAWVSDTNVVSISAVFTQTKNYYNNDSLNRLKDDLVVTATYENGSTAAITGYMLSGTLSLGTSVITVSYEGKTATFNVIVSEGFYYTPSLGLLKDQSYITYSESGNMSTSPFTESVVDDYLRLYAVQAGTSQWANALYDLQNTNIANYGRLKIDFRVIEVASVSASNTTTKGTLFAQEVSNNGGSFFGIFRDGSMSSNVKFAYSDSAVTTKGPVVSLNTWHTGEIIIENGTQSVKYDDSNVLTGSVLSTIPSIADGVNRVSFAANNQTACEVHIRSIEFELRS